MKKIIALLLAIMMIASLTACVTPDSGTTTKPSEPSVPGSGGQTNGGEKAMTYAEYMAAEDGMVVTVEFYNQISCKHSTCNIN